MQFISLLVSLTHVSLASCLRQLLFSLLEHCPASQLPYNNSTNVVQELRSFTHGPVIVRPIWASHRQTNILHKLLVLTCHASSCALKALTLGVVE